MTPLDCSSVIQLVVLTSSDVQNGSSTMIISQLLMRGGSPAIRWAIGNPSSRQNSVTARLTHSVRRKILR